MTAVPIATAMASPAGVAAVSAASPPGGSSPVPLAGLGLLALVGGGIVFFVARRRRPPEDEPVPAADNWELDRDPGGILSGDPLLEAIRESLRAGVGAGAGTTVTAVRMKAKGTSTGSEPPAPAWVKRLDPEIVAMPVRPSLRVVTSEGDGGDGLPDLNEQVR